MKLNIKTIMAAEKLLKKPFSDFDLSDEKVVGVLTYCMCSDSMVCSREQFNTLPEEEKRKMSRVLENEIAYNAQFSNPEESGEDSTDEKVWITDLANRLIMLGKVDQRYILQDMRLWELKDLLKASEEYVRSEMEERRFWTYLQMLPHINLKKIKKPSDLISFPWDGQKTKEEKEAEFEKGIEMFEKFFNSKPENHE